MLVLIVQSCLNKLTNNRFGSIENYKVEDIKESFSTSIIHKTIYHRFIFANEKQTFIVCDVSEYDQEPTMNENPTINTGWLRVGELVEDGSLIRLF